MGKSQLPGLSHDFHRKFTADVILSCDRDDFLVRESTSRLLQGKKVVVELEIHYAGDPNFCESRVAAAVTARAPSP
jgi:hypothetical protein